LIGVTSVENKLTLVTDNVSDFQNIENIKIKTGLNENKLT
jgi:predicted nucleic acid-binding protein